MTGVMRFVPDSVQHRLDWSGELERTGTTMQPTRRLMDRARLVSESEVLDIRTEDAGDGPMSAQSDTDGTINPSEEQQTEVHAYDDYSSRFRGDGNAERYLRTYRPRSKIEMLKLKGIVGWFVAKAEILAVRRMLSKCSGVHIVDVPSGSGKMLPELLRMYDSIVSIDCSIDMLARMRGSDPERSAIVVGDIRRLPVRDDAIDIVLCHRFLHRIPPELHVDALKELHRVCRKCGVFYYAVNSSLLGMVVRLEKALNLGDRGKIFFLSEEAIKDELQRNGWEIIGVTSVIPLVSSGYTLAVRKVHG